MLHVSHFLHIDKKNSFWEFVISSKLSMCVFEYSHSNSIRTFFKVTFVIRKKLLFWLPNWVLMTPNENTNTHSSFIVQFSPHPLIPSHIYDGKKRMKENQNYCFIHRGRDVNIRPFESQRCVNSFLFCQCSRLICLRRGKVWCWSLVNDSSLCYNGS